MTDEPASVTRHQPMAADRFVEVAVANVRNSATHGVFTYVLPVDIEVVRGQLVSVPLRNRVERGIVTAVDVVAPDFDARPLHDVRGTSTVLHDRHLNLATWMARETASSVFACVALFLPPGIENRTTELYAMATSHVDTESLTAMQRRVMAALEANGEMVLDQLQKVTGQALTSVLPALVEKGAVTRRVMLEEQVPGPRTRRFVRLLDDTASLTARAPRQAAVREALMRFRRVRQSTSADLIALTDLREHVPVDLRTLQAMAAKDVIELVELSKDEVPVARHAFAPVLTGDQASVWSAVERALQDGDPTPHLLFGVTGSGKTEIYMRGVAWCLRNGRSAIILVPEIGLATQVVRRFVDRFPGEVVVVHSGQTDSQRYETWRGIAAGDHRVVVGPRSALFSPVVDLGMIVLDEEHEGAYKQDVEPRYHARRVAMRLAQDSGAALILGSATPSVDSSWMADQGDAHRLVLSERVNPLGSGSVRERSASLQLPTVEIVDIRQELQTGSSGLLSGRLQEAVATSLQNGEQAILLLNRRGTSTVVLCRSCGHRLECPHCDIPLVYHRDRQSLICHRCDFRHVPYRTCPQCNGPLDYFGAGTQRVEDEVRRRFRSARVMRWDQDSIRAQGGFERMLGRVERGEVDIVVGTQMVAKGFDLPNVRVIGVVQADTMLHLPDFRSAERTFQLLTQVAGRAGRRAGGAVAVIQTYTPDHYAIQAASRHDYGAFYEEEIDFRDRHGYPPFVRLIRFVCRHDRERDAAVEAEMMSRELARHARQRGVTVDLLGPTPAFAARIRGAYQWQVVLRSNDVERLLDDLPVRPGWLVDVDPQSML